MALFGFFALVLVAVYWVNQAVRLFDKLISDGQTAWVVLEFTALTLPYVIRVVLPIAAFAATVYAVNRLNQESELVVMQATGASPWRLGRPVLVFGLIVAALMSMLSHELVPASRERLAIRQNQIASDVTTKLLVAGQFQHPAPGITIYIREISQLGELTDLYLSDSRSKGARMSYTAQKAVIVKSDGGPKLIMFDGVAQTLRYSDNRLAITRFSNFTYDIGALIQQGDALQRKLEQVTSRELLFGDGPALQQETGASPAQIRLELATRFAQPLLAPVAALIGFGALMMGSFSRFGVWRQISFAVIGLIVVQGLSNVVEGNLRGRPELWGLSFLPAAVGCVIALAFLWQAARPRRRPRAPRALPPDPADPGPGDAEGAAP